MHRDQGLARLGASSMASRIPVVSCGPRGARPSTHEMARLHELCVKSGGFLRRDLGLRSHPLVLTRSIDETVDASMEQGPQPEGGFPAIPRARMLACCQTARINPIGVHQPNRCPSAQ